MRQMNINKGNYEVKSHYKMYKAGKRWVVAGMATVSLLGGLLMLSTDASADGVDAVVPASESSVTAEVSAPTDSVVLDSASASVAPASSVSAEVSASSASSVAPVSVSTSVSVVSAAASLSASQSLASSVVVPADAVKVRDDVDADGNVQKAYVLADAQGTTADTQTPDSAVTPVQTNAAYTSSTTAKTATVPAASTSGTIGASSYIKTDSAENHTSFSYSGSSQINDYFNQTGDITNLSDVDVTNSSFRSGAYSTVGVTSQSAYDSSLAASRNYYTSYYTSYYKSVNKSITSATLETSVTNMVSAAMSGKPDYADVPSSVSNAIRTANSVANKVLPSQSKVEDIDWKALVPEVKNEGGTLSYQSQLDVLKGFEIKGGYRLVSIDQTTGAIRVSTSVTGAQAVGVVMAPVQPTVMGTPSIAGSKSLNNNDAIATINNAVISGRDMYVNNDGDVSSQVVHIRQTNSTGDLNGYKDDTGVNPSGKGTPGVTDSGYAWTTENNGKTVTNPVHLKSGDADTTGTTTAAQGDLYKGVYFDYKWTNPTLNANGTVTATLTYTEYSDSAMTKVIGTVTNTLTVDRYMAVGLYAANGGNGNSFFGGISYFQGTNATADVNVSYKFGKNEDTLLPDTKINAVVGEKIKITDAKTTLSVDSGMTVTYVAPDVPGFKIDPSSTMSATAGSNDLKIKYVVNQDDFNDQVTNAKTALDDIDKSIGNLQAMIDADPSSIDVQSVLTKMQDIRKQAVDKIATLQTIADGSVDLDTVAKVQDALQKIMQGANDVSALATDAANQIDLAKEITKNAVSIHKNISDDTDVMTAKNKINDDIASGQSAVDIADDKVDLEGKVATATQKRQAAIADADKAVAENTVKNALVEGAKSALQVLTGESTPKDDTHTKTEIDAGVANLTKVSTVDVPANVMDAQDVKDAIANVTDLLTKDPTNNDAIDEALQGLKEKIDQAKAAVAKVASDAKTVANTAVPTNVSDQDHTALDTAKQHLQEVAENADSTATDIATAQQQVADELKKLTDARAAEIVKGTAVASTKVPDNATDQTEAIKQLQDDQDALTAIMNNDDSTLTQIQTAEKKVTGDLTQMKQAITDAKTAANGVITEWNGKSNLYTDQTDALKTIQDDIDHLNAVVKNENSTVSAINDAKKQLKDDIDTVTDARNGSVSAGNNLVDGLTDQQKKDALVDASVTELNKAINDGTKSAIDTAVEKVKTAVDTMIDEDINDVPAVVTAKQKIVDLLKGDTVDATAVKEATDALKVVTGQADADLIAKKSAAKNAEIPANLKDQFGKLDAATQKKLTDEVAGLTTAAAKDGVKVSELQPKLDQLQTDLADMQKNLQDAQKSAQAVADAKAPANVVDQAVAGSAYETAKTALDNALKEKDATASDLATAQAAVTKALQDMQTNVNKAKENANKVADSWTDESNKFTDQDMSAVEQALNDLAGLSDDATQADYERVQTELETAKKEVEKVRDDAVTAGNTVADGVSEAQKKDDLVNKSLGELTNAIATGTASEITTAADKVENAVKAIVDVPVDDVPAVVSAKQKVVDLLNNKQLDDKKIADAIGELKDALKQANADLQTAKETATVVEPVNLHDQIEDLSKDDQGKLATAVSNLKNLVNTENDGTTKASDIKTQQDIVDGILNKLKDKRDAEVANGKAVAGTSIPENATDQTAAIKQLQDDQATLASVVANDDSTLTQIQEAEQKVADDLSHMADTVSKAKNDANGVVTDWNGKLNLYADQTDVMKTIQADVDKLNGLTATDNKTATKQEIDDAREKLATDIATVEQKRQAVATNADNAMATVTNGDNDDVKERVAAVKDAEKTGTASDIAKAVAKLQTADATVVPTNISDDDDVTAAKTPVDDALKNDGDLTAAKKSYDDAVSQAKTKLADAKTSAKGDAAAWDEVSSLYADQTDETSAIQKDIDTLNGLTANDKATKKQIDDARKQLQDDIDVVKGVRNDAVTDGKNTADANKDNGDAEVQTTVGKLNNALDNGTASDIKTAIENVKTAVDTVVVPNISDSDDVADAKKAVNDALNAPKLDKTAVQNAVDNFNTAVAKAQKDLADTKDGATNDEKSWTADAPKYADQTTTTIQNDIDHLNELTSDKTATKKTIDAARKQLQEDIKTVADVRDAAVKTADDANKAVVNGDNEDVKNHQAAVDNAVKTGTASDIAKAVAKLQTADATVVPTNLSDDADVTAAKTTVDDALKNEGDVATAKKAYDNAVEQAKTKLADAKQDANDDTSAWDKAASLYTDQDTDDIQKDVKKLNDLVADKTATKSDIDDAREQLPKDIAVVTGARDGAVDDGNDTVDANAANDDAEVKTTVDTLKDAIANGTKKAIETAINKVKTAVDTIVAANISDDADVNAAKKAVNDILNADGLDTDKLTKATDKLTTVVDDAKKALQATKDGASDDESSWNDDAPKYADQDMTAIQNDINHLNELTSDKTATKTAIDDARKQLQDDIKAVDDVRQTAVDKADDAVVAVKNGDNDDVKNRVAAVKDAEKTGTATDVAKAVAKLQTADATVVPTNVSDDADVTAAKTAVDDALNNDGDADTAKTAYDNAVATAQATLKQAVADANAVKVPANLQDQVEMAKKNKLGDVNQQVTDLQNAADQDDTTATTLRSGMSDIQARLDDMTAKLNTTRDAAQKLVDQTADATDTNVVAARKQVTSLLANNDTTTMTDLQNAMNVLTATSKPADANVVKTPAAPVKSGQVSTTVADGDTAFAIVTDANGKQTVVQMSKDANGTATANVPGAKDAQVVTVSKNGK